MQISPLRTSAARLALGYGAIFTLGVSALLGTVYFLTTTVLDNEADAVISAELEGLTDAYHRAGLPGLADELSFRGDSWNGTGAVYLLVDPNLVKEGGNITNWPFDDIPAGQWTQFRIEAHVNDSVVTHPVRASISLLPDGHRLLVGIDVTQQGRFASTFRYATLWAIGLTALAGAIAAYFLSRKLTRRVQSVADTCDAIVGGDLDRRLPMDGSQDEFDALALAVNNMVDRLAENAQLLRATFDSAAHDLRGPLYRLRGRLEDASRIPTTDAPVRAGIDAALTELDRVQRTLATLLQIAQAESSTAANHAPVDLAELITDIGELYEPAAREKSMSLRVEASGDCRVHGNRQLLAQAVANLVENSLKYIPAGGHIDIRAGREWQTVWLTVADDGPGIAQRDRAAALKPFVRLAFAQAKEGSGLGLSLVAAIARLHHAQLLLEDNEPGLRVRLGLAAGV